MGRCLPIPSYVGQPPSEEAPCVSSQTQVKRQRKESLNLWRKKSSAQGRFWQTSSPNNIRTVFTNAESSAWLREHPLPSGLPGRGRRPDRRMRLVPACARSSCLLREALPPWWHWPPFFASPGESLTPGRWARAEEPGRSQGTGEGWREGGALKERNCSSSRRSMLSLLRAWKPGDSFKHIHVVSRWVSSPIT